MLILGLTWFFGSKRAEQVAIKQRNTANLVYLRSLLTHALQNLLILRKLLIDKRDILLNFKTSTTQQQIELFSNITFKDAYSHFLPEKHTTVAEQCPDIIINLLQIKTFLIDVFNTIDLCNRTLPKKAADIPPLIIALRHNLPNLLMKNNYAIVSIWPVLENIKYLEKTLDLKLLQIPLNGFQQEEIIKIFQEVNEFKQKASIGTSPFSTN